MTLITSICRRLSSFKLNKYRNDLLGTNYRLQNKYIISILIAISLFKSILNLKGKKKKILSNLENNYNNKVMKI